jgi:thiol-disulfide isomerase/thioredoxin
VESPSPYPALLVVEQDGNHATGTILTETGDYRFLEGSTESDRLFLSTFDGSHAYLFEAKLLEDGTLSGVYRSGNHYKTYWNAERNDTFRLRDPYTLTGVKENDIPFSFRFPNPDGDTVSLDDAQYAGKPKIVTIFGTWCPNCLDENSFLSDYMKAHPDLGIEIVSIAFERQPDPALALQAIRNYRRHFGIPWQILYGGSSNKNHVAESLPMLENFISFPTMLFLDRENRVVKIHTGFYGPATEKYAGFREEFEQTVRRLISLSPNG